MKPISNSWATCGRTFFASSSWSNVFPIGWYPYHIPITSINSYNIPIIMVDNSRYLSYSYNCWYEKPIHVLLMDQWFRVFFQISPQCSGKLVNLSEYKPNQLCTTFVAEYLGVATWLLIHISMFHGYIPSFLMVKFKLQLQSTFLLVQSVKSESLNIFDVCQVSKYCRLFVAPVLSQKNSRFLPCQGRGRGRIWEAPCRVGSCGGGTDWMS